MGFLSAIREKSLRGVALSCDVHVIFASSGKIRQSCTVSLGDSVSSETFLSSQHFCAGNLHMFHHTRQTQVHQIVPADLVEIAVRQRPQTVWFGLAMQSSLTVFVPLH